MTYEIIDWGSEKIPDQPFVIQRSMNNLVFIIWCEGQACKVTVANNKQIVTEDLLLLEGISLNKAKESVDSFIELISDSK